MLREKGISMISLIVTIIAIIILASLAISTGIRYIKESSEREEQNFIAVLSSAVSRRQEDIHLNSALFPYVGYRISDETYFNQVIAPKVNDSLDFSNGNWYIVDTAIASSLGVRDSNNYIDEIVTGSSDRLKVALVDYMTGETYIINIASSDTSTLPKFDGDIENGHEHRYLIAAATCTEALRCADCGFILQEALGHNYDDTASPKPVVGDEENTHYNKVCTRCGMPGGYERHTYEYVWALVSGKWTHHKICLICKYETAPEDCARTYSLPTSDTERATYHKVTCHICEHTALEAHTFVYRRVSESLHERYCSVPECGYIVATESHIDNNGDNRCDLCGSAIVDHTYPILKTVTMINKSATTTEGRYIATYGETVRLTFVADKPISNLVVRIAGQTITNLSTTDNITWVAEYTLTTATPIPEGEISLYISCKSTAGIDILAPVTRTSDDKYVIFDSTRPTGEYIDKDERAKESE